MDVKRYEKARQARDPRFDGRFFVAVKTTGIYCRPICPVKIPRPENVEFYPTAAAANEAGFRPCLRCRPEAAPGTPAWLGTATTVQRALRLISEGALDEVGVAGLSDRLGVSTRHLSRLFDRYIGASPKAVAQTRRLQLAKKLIDETELPMVTVAGVAGYGSVRRFNDHFKAVYGRTPGSLRPHRDSGGEEGFTLRLEYRPPFDYDGLLAFFAGRAIPGVEQVEHGVYRRTILAGNEPGTIEVSHEAGQRRLLVRLAIAEPQHIATALERVQHMFDLRADPVEIERHLGRDRQLAPIVKRFRGQRLPGCWDGFEIAVRAIVGQQVSVAGATNVMGQIAREYGCQTPRGLCFPTPQQLAQLDVAALPMPGQRAAALRELSRAVAAGDIDLSGGADTDAVTARLLQIKGIGPWTAQYIGMRVLGNPDAFPDRDLVLLKAAKRYLGIDDARELSARADAWRPWRAYAAVLLWRHFSQ